MRKDKQIAIQLRKEGNSYSQIRDTLGVSKSTLSYWLRDLKISENARRKISARAHKISIAALIERNKNQTALAKERAKRIRLEAQREANKLIKRPLFIAGTSLYWAEGYKKGAFGSKWKGVDFANSDSSTVKVMMKFFRNICGVPNDKFRIQLMVHPNVDTEKAIAYWSKMTKISKDQFMKISYAVSKSSKKKRNPNSLIYGTIHIRICDVKLFFRIIGWIDGLKEKLT
ncbi:MAG: hypothetical protein COZ87_03420 [Candidatus Moranbacteria bacterium CG_4_8_14_3_um_filter_43_15]|nr:MAG: hypothetical protein COW51_03450 [Candidatus Moranbacteria bacterium CG17_big_fil_post_rev_8_21_14_2_50_44_12]PIW93068.1 MAG: hypothetical protein COZ87_03420 [Candidatus Moranbacteria bacterium CG_4_8_14_3_um_filter_43_15]PJA85858.1 MAG: hypothetical protein CO142_02680 [Candidatus Moranbacteria bacterium CG_4_9_14_3_um_filter_44_28]